MKLLKAVMIFCLLIISLPRQMKDFDFDFDFDPEEHEKEKSMKEGFKAFIKNENSNYKQQEQKNYIELLKVKSNTLVENVYYSHNDGKIHGSIFITLKDTDGAIRYERIESGSVATYNATKKIEKKEGTSIHAPTSDLTLEKANNYFKSIDPEYSLENFDEKEKILYVKNCFSFTDILIEKLTGEKLDYTNSYFKDKYSNCKINKSKKKFKKLRKVNKKS